MYPECDACIHDACIHDTCIHGACIHDACIHDAANFVTNERTDKAILGVGWVQKDTKVF